MTGPTVIKLGGAALDAAAELDALCADIVRVHREAVASGGGLILVHGGGGAVDRRFAALGIEVEKIDGLRVTREENVHHVVGVIAGEVNASLCARLVAHGASAVGVTLSSAGLRCVVQEGRPELGRVGRVAGAADDRLVRWCADGALPVVACVGDDGGGGLLNVNGDDAAGGLAAAVGAERVVLLTDVEGVRGATGETLRELDHARARELMECGVIAGGMVPKVRSALELSERSGAAVVIAPWSMQGVLGAIAGGGVVGTRITAANKAETTETHA